MKTLLLAFSLALVLASNMLGMCIGCGGTYLPPTLGQPSLGSGAAVTGGTAVEAPPAPSLFGSGFLIAGPMDVQASSSSLQLQFTLTSTFTPNTSTQYWIYSFLGDFIWSNQLGTTAQLDSVTSDAYINLGTCAPPDTGCTTLADGSTSLGPISIPYDPASTYSSGVNAYYLSSYWGTTSSVGLNSGATYTLVHTTTFNISGLASGEIIRIDLPETSDVSGAPEPATWGLALLGIGLTGYRRWKRGR